MTQSLYMPEVTIRFRQQLLTTGTSDREIRSRRDHASWSPLRRGAYVDARELAALDSRAKYVLTLAAFAGHLPMKGVFSHVSAAALRDWPLWRVHVDRVHLTRDGDGGANRRSGLHVHARNLVKDQRSQVGSWPVTSSALTVVDCARMTSFVSGVVLADAALHLGDVTAVDLETELHRARGFKGIARARAVVAFANGLSESPGESRSRIVFATSGLPPMELQHRIRGVDRRTIARVDFAIPELKVAGEFDGKIKYGRLLMAGDDVGDVVFKEKRREDAIRDAGWEVVRWVWDELDEPRIIIERWQRAIARARVRS